MNLIGNEEPSLSLIKSIDQDDEMSYSEENKKLDNQLGSNSIAQEEQQEEVSFGEPYRTFSEVSVSHILPFEDE